MAMRKWTGSTSAADWVRHNYGVPARRFSQVRVDGHLGRITSFDPPYINVRFEGERRSQPCHPSWRVEYL
jgi:hypothetical protein